MNLRTILMCFLATVASAASFDCKQAKGTVETLICSNSELSELDERLAGHYAGAKVVFSDADACVRSDQLQWLRNVRNRCADAGCLKKVHLERLSELDALQPGVSAIKDLRLPRVPQLVWIIPPAKPTTGAPVPAQTPLKATGKLEQVEGGWLLRARNGSYYSVTSDEFFNERTYSELNSIAVGDGRRTPVITIRGYASAATDHPRFDPCRCVFLYRMP